MSSRLKRKIPAFGPALVAVIAIGAIGASGASALSFSRSLEGPADFEILGGETSLNVDTTERTVRCTGDIFGHGTTGIGEFSGFSGSNSQEGLMQLELNGCKDSSIFHFSCTTEGREKGHIVTTVLRYKLVYLDAAKTKFGFLLSPRTEGGAFAEYKCTAPVVVKGELLGQVVSPALNVETKSFEIWFQRSAVSQQAYRQVEEAGPERYLSQSFNGGAYVPVGYQAEWNDIMNQKGKFIP